MKVTNPKRMYKAFGTKLSMAQICNIVGDKYQNAYYYVNRAYEGNTEMYLRKRGIKDRESLIKRLDEVINDESNAD